MPSLLNSHPVIECWAHFLAKDRGKEVIFRKVIEELKKERKRDEGVRLIGFLHPKLRRCESMS